MPPTDLTERSEESEEARWERFTRRLFARNQFAMKLGLEAMKRALALCDLSSLSHRVILVAGTNGKGTTSSVLAAALRASGLRVGLYTSPHLIDLTERFRLNGAIASREDLLEIGEPMLKRFSSTAGEGGEAPELTFFEITTLMAVSWFESRQVDVAVYEVGLGGRLDATNALSPDLCLLTTIGYDHQRYLGETLSRIVAEKLGITRPGVALIAGRQEHRGAQVELTSLRHTPLYVFNRNFGLQQEFDPTASSESERAQARSGVWWYDRSGAYHGVAISSWGDMNAPYQRAHVASALTACDHLLERVAPGRRLQDDVMRQVVASCRWPGRLDAVTFNEGSPWHGLRLFCDAAHNVDGVRALVQALEERQSSPELVIFSTLQDKDASEMLSRIAAFMAQRATETSLFLCLLENPRASTRERFLQVQREVSWLGPVQIGTVGELATALRTQLAESQVKVDALAFGSIYLLGELWSALGHRVV